MTHLLTKEHLEKLTTMLAEALKLQDESCGCPQSVTPAHTISNEEIDHYHDCHYMARVRALREYDRWANAKIDSLGEVFDNMQQMQ